MFSERSHSFIFYAKVHLKCFSLPNCFHRFPGKLESFTLVQTQTITSVLAGWRNTSVLFFACSCWKCLWASSYFLRRKLQVKGDSDCAALWPQAIYNHCKAKKDTVYFSFNYSIFPHMAILSWELTLNLCGNFLCLFGLKILWRSRWFVPKSILLWTCRAFVMSIAVLIFTCSTIC